MQQEDEDDYAVTVGPEFSVRALYESGELIDAGADERSYGANEAINNKVFIWWVARSIPVS